jgi:hypothetical protein
MASRDPYAHKRYRENRPRVLARDNHTCRYCGKPATTVDHIVGLQAGGDHSMDNLTACCVTCNSRKGQRDQAVARNRRLDARNRALTDQGFAINTTEPKNETEFLGATDSPRPALIAVSAGNQPELAGMGRDRPRLETPVSDWHGSRAAEVGGWAKTFLGVDLMPFQLNALDGMTALREDGRFAHRMACLSTARQAGKSTLAAAILGWALTVEPQRRGSPMTVLSTAHRLDLAVEMFHRLADILEIQFGAKVLRAYGRNEVKMPDGTRWLVKAATPTVGHGLSVDLVVADEIWAIGPEAMDQGIVPTMRARPNPLLVMFSTAGTEASEVMLRYREQAIRGIDAGKPGPLYWCEYSPPPDLDPMTVAAWEYANPSLGRTISLETLEAESHSPDRAAFLRASVNLWVASDKGWIAPGVWPKLLVDPETVPAGGVVALEVSLDDARYFGLRAVPVGEGRVAVTVAFVAETITEWRQHVDALAADSRLRFAVTPTLDIHFPPNLENRKVTVGYRELVQYTPAVKQMIDQRRVVHTGEAMLAEHVQRAVAVRTQSSLALSSQRSPGPIELARCLVWAVALASKSSASGKPMIVIAGG